MNTRTTETIERHQLAVATGFVPSLIPDMNRLQVMTNANEQEVLEFLRARPVQTIVMMSFIQDNGIESPLNRGKFYGFRNQNGALEGVALIGHTTIVESRSNDALLALALAARNPETPIHLIMADGETSENFWQKVGGGQSPRLVCREILFELVFPVLVQNCEWNVRLARAAELPQIVEAHAEVAFLESGVNPLERDREGFLKRTLRRIEKERTFVVFDGGKLLFKADIVAETSEAIYLEGIYVAPKMRGQGIGAKCLAALSANLLNRVEHISLLSNTEFTNAHRSFAKAGFKPTGNCTSVFV